MGNKTCGECRFYNPDYNLCLHWRHEDINEHSPICNYFKPNTNGDRIIAGGMRELAKAMVYGYRERDFDGEVMDGMLYTWHLPNAKAFTEYNEAVDYLEAWLNAPAESEVSE